MSYGVASSDVYVRVCRVWYGVTCYTPGVAGAGAGTGRSRGGCGVYEGGVVWCGWGRRWRGFHSDVMASGMELLPV